MWLQVYNAFQLKNFYLFFCFSFIDNFVLFPVNRITNWIFEARFYVDGVMQWKWLVLCWALRIGDYVAGRLIFFLIFWLDLTSKVYLFQTERQKLYTSLSLHHFLHPCVINCKIRCSFSFCYIYEDFAHSMSTGSTTFSSEDNMSISN